MWPKLLFELLPHFSRLLPAADKYLSTRSASDKAQEAALASLAAEVRVGFGRTADTSEGLGRQLKEQGAQIAELGVDVTRARMVVESVEGRVAKLEKSVALVLRLLWVILVLLVMMFTIVVVRKV